MSKFESSFIGILGGTFDPIHYGHLRIAEEIVEAVGLREMHFVPAGRPCLRYTPIASPQHRTAMVRAAIQNNPGFILDERETRRSGPSYSVESLREFKQEMGKNITLCFVMGADAFIKLTEWHNWRELFRLCHVIIAARPGHALATNHDILPQELREECAQRWVSNASSLECTSSGLIFVAPTTLLDISATAIRVRISAKRSVRYLLPDTVLDYIETNHLYSGEE